MPRNDLIRLTIHTCLCSLFFVASLTTSASAEQGAHEDAPEAPLVVSPSNPHDYTFSYWLNGRRGQPKSEAPDVVGFESSRYYFALDVAKLDKPLFQRKSRHTSYLTSVSSPSPNSTSSSKLNIELEIDGKFYTATQSLAAIGDDPKRLDNVWMWESGRLVQRIEFQGLQFEDKEGVPLGTSSSLLVTAWPSSLTLTTQISPSLIYQDSLTEGITGAGRCVLDEPIDIPHSDALESEKLTVEAWVRIPESLASQNSRHWVLCKNANQWKDGNYGFQFWGDRLQATMNIGGGKNNFYQIDTLPKAFKKDQWNHLVLTYDGSTMRFYMNGLLQGEKEIGKKRMGGKGLMRIGQRADGHGQTMKALFDDVRVWDRALTPEQIKSHTENPSEIASREGLTFEQSFGDDVPQDSKPPVWHDAKIYLSLESGLDLWEASKEVAGVWAVDDKHNLSLTCRIAGPPQPQPQIMLRVINSNGKELPLAFDETRQCVVAEQRKLHRDWPTGYTDIRNYDEFEITVANDGNSPTSAPFMLDFYDVGNITGLSPILCDQDGVPLGIPVQLSKNWHDATLGVYLRAYAMLPAPSGTITYKLRIPYGFYGTLPTASHSQLSLIGWGGNGQWDQLAVGCWGETICFDIGQSSSNVAITDVRGLMLRNGTDGKKWGWTDAGWGGDWLKVHNSKGDKLFFAETKTAFLSHGPCLTDVRYHGYYGEGKSVQFDTRVQTTRTDDYARTFQTLEYNFKKDLPEQDGWLFKMGRSMNWHTPMIAYGNEKGLIEELTISDDVKPGQVIVDQVKLTGNGPWWIAFPDAGPLNQNDPKGPGSRALIIRSYEASLNGKQVDAPTINVKVHRVQPDGRCDVDLMLVPPKETPGFVKDDKVNLDIEWISLPATTDDYYGPNEPFIQYLTEHPRSWKPVYREALGNALRVKASGGQVIKNYPIEIASDSPQVKVDVTGGVGFVPIRFSGLDHFKGYALYQIVDGNPIALDQSVHGNDFWQTDFDADSKTYSLTYNLPLDGLKQSTWVLKHKEVQAE